VTPCNRNEILKSRTTLSEIKVTDVSCEIPQMQYKCQVRGIKGTGSVFPNHCLLSKMPLLPTVVKDLSQCAITALQPSVSRLPSKKRFIFPKDYLTQMGAPLTSINSPWYKQTRQGLQTGR